MKTFRQDVYVKKGLAEDMTDDRQLCLDLRDLLETHHISMGWYSKGFDLSHLRSRLALHRERLLCKHLHHDGMWSFKGWRGLKFGSAKLAKVAEALGLEPKPSVEPDIWMKAKGGNKKAIDEVCDRCEADVRITAAAIEYAADNRLFTNIQMY